jgi:hypothetical protein
VVQKYTHYIFASGARITHEGFASGAKMFVPVVQKEQHPKMRVVQFTGKANNALTILNKAITRLVKARID